MNPILHSGPGIVIGLPTLGRPVSIDWALAFKSLNPPINYNSLFQIVQGQEIGLARQAIAEFALERKAKYLFFIGDDVVIPSHTLRHLIYYMEQNPEIGIVGGVYCAKATPAFPLVFRGNGQGSYWDWKIGEFFECTGLGMDCTLIRVDLLKDLSKPWFKTVDSDKFIDGKNEAESWTEDLYFCNKVLSETQYKIYCDGGVICEHIDIYGGKKYSLPPGSLPMRQKGVVKDKKCLIIGEPLALMDETFDVTTFGNEDSDYRGYIGALPFEEGQFDFLVSSKFDLSFPIYVNELLRVVKVGGKISVLPAPFMSYSDISEWFDSQLNLKTKRDGNYLEFVKA